MVVTARMANAHKLFNHIQHTVSYQTFTNELCQLWSYCTEVHEIYRGIIYAFNAHISDIPFHFGMTGVYIFRCCILSTPIGNINYPVSVQNLSSLVLIKGSELEMGHVTVTPFLG